MSSVALADVNRGCAGDRPGRTIARRFILAWAAAAAAGAASPAKADALKVLESSPADRAVLKGASS